MTDQQVIDEYNKARNVMSSLRTHYTKAGKVAFKTAAQKLFEDNPDLTSFAWDQFTPGFNDGDPCQFSVHRDSLYINDYREEYDDIKESGLSEKKFIELQDKVAALINQYSDEDLKLFFGDTAKITVTKKGINVDYYQPY